MIASLRGRRPWKGLALLGSIQRRACFGFTERRLIGGRYSKKEGEAIKIFVSAGRYPGLLCGNSGECHFKSLGARDPSFVAQCQNVPPIYVKPYIKREKNDANHVEAITEAASVVTMRFVAVKSAEKQASGIALRSRD